jgi:pyruvate,water dikinase
MIRPLAEATDAAAFGGKAVQLGAAIRAGLSVPAGFALSSEHVKATACGDPAALAALQALCPDSTPSAVRSWAVRSSAIDEDSGAASFAGSHLSVLGVCGFTAVVQAVREVHASGRDPGAYAYRARLGLERTSRMAVVVQELVDADVAGVLFTRNPVTGAAERVIEASWGLGEAVVSGLVTPDQYRLDPTGCLLKLSVGEKDLQVRRSGSGGTEQVPVAPELTCARCLGDGELAALHALAAACDRVFGSPDHDIEFAFRGGAVFLLQRRPITSG